MITYEELQQRYPRYLYLSSSRISSYSDMCFGCNEGRDGETSIAGRSLDTGIYPGDYQTNELIVMEFVCSGNCMNFLNGLRRFTIPFAQVESHEGSVIWAISRKNYEEHKELFKKYSITQYE